MRDCGKRPKVTPYHYFRYIQDDQWAFGIMGNGGSKQVIVGAVVLESYYVVFDRQVRGTVRTVLCSAVQCRTVLAAWPGPARLQPSQAPFPGKAAGRARGAR